MVAAAGYGKTTALEARCADGSTRYTVATDLVAGGCDQWLADVGSTGHLAVDDVCALPIPAQVRLVSRLSGSARGVAFTLAYRHPPGSALRAVLPDPATERGPGDLALSGDDVARVLRDEHGLADTDIAHLVRDLTAGWPMLVHLAGSAASRDGANRHELLAAVTEPGTPGHRWVSEHVLADLPTSMARMLEEVADLDPITEPLCDALADGRPTPGFDGRDWLVRAGLLTPGRGLRRPGLSSQHRAVPIIATIVGQRRRVSRADDVRGKGDTQDRLRLAAGWYADNGFPLAAARAWAEAGEPSSCAALIEGSGAEMLASGQADEVIRLVRTLPEQTRTPGLRLILADAARMVGDVDGAGQAFTALLAEAERDGHLAAGLVWRAATLHYLRSDYPNALALLNRVSPSATPDVDDVLVGVCRATVLAALGDLGRAAEAAQAALADAVDNRAVDDRGLAAAHLAVAITTNGVRRDVHLTDALAAAERGGDVVLQVRILTNQADDLLRRTQYPQALSTAERAVQAAEVAGPLGLLGVALYNAGAALTRLGRYDEAILRFERSMRVAARSGPTRAAAGLYGLGEVNRHLGRREQSRAAFEEAADLARSCADLQVLIPTLAGLTRLLLEGGDTDPASARCAATEAERLAPSPLRPLALTARGWVALFDGDVGSARCLAADAGRAARESRQTDLLAEALELTAAVSSRPADSRAALQEAASIWHQAGAQPAEDRMLVLLARIPDSDGPQRLAARAATERLVARGVKKVGGSDLLTMDTLAGSVRVSVLGGFEVVVGGQAVALPAWRSRQARTLLKILVARRGRPVARGELCELLWPDDEPQRTAHRLSVLLSAVRNVLDQTRRWPTDHYLRADIAGVSLDYSRVTVDAEELLRDATHGAQLARSGDGDQASELLAEVDAAYRGDAFGDEPYEEWADAFREQVRAGWLQALRALVELLRSAKELDRAATALVRLLGADPYDEWAHRTLVELLLAAGRHGEARRAFDRWAGAMQSLDAPAPDPAVLTGRVGRLTQHG